MQRRVETRLAAAALMVVLAASAGCGGGGGGGDGGANPTPARTSTPVPTATATPAPAATASVAFDVGASVPLTGLQFTATYPVAKGSFSGSADGVQCTTAAAGVLTKNDRDDGALVLSLASATALPLPTAVRCVFDLTAGQHLGVRDIGIAAHQATDADGVTTDPGALTVGVRVE